VVVSGSAFKDAAERAQSVDAVDIVVHTVTAPELPDSFAVLNGLRHEMQKFSIGTVISSAIMGGRKK